MIVLMGKIFVIIYCMWWKRYVAPHSIGPKRPNSLPLCVVLRIPSDQTKSTLVEAAVPF